MTMSKNTEFLYGYHTIKVILKKRPQDVVQLYLLETRHDKRATEIMALATSHHILCKSLTVAECDQLIGDVKNHQGIIAECKPSRITTESDWFNSLAEKKSALIVILDGVQDPHNLGACLRSANAFGVTAVLIPKDRSAPLSDVAKKAASGAAETTPLITVTNLNRMIKQLQAMGIWFVGLDTQASLHLREVDLTDSIGIVLGGEGRGLRRLTRETCDYLAKIDIQGDVDSLNVSVATGIALYEVKRQRMS